MKEKEVVFTEFDSDMFEIEKEIEKWECREMSIWWVCLSGYCHKKYLEACHIFWWHFSNTYPELKEYDSTIRKDHCVVSVIYKSK